IAVPGCMQYGDYRWDEQGVPAGPTWVRVDLKSQIISVFRGGQEIGTAVILYGADGLPTPTGKFPVLAKLKHHWSQTYDAPMPYTLRLTADGVSIHGSNVRWGYATHGCIGVPTVFAAKLFDTVSVGDEVLIVVGGDSVTEYERFDRLCGRPALNAGIAWSRTTDWLPVAGSVIENARPSIVILALGLNDRITPQWKSDFRKLARVSHAQFAVGADDPAKDQFMGSLMPLARR